MIWAEVGQIKLALYDSESGWDDTIDVNLPEHHGEFTAMGADVAIGDTGVTVLWNHYINGTTPLWARHYDQDLGWESPVELDPGTPYRYARDMIALADGQTLAVWRRSQALYNGAHTVTYSCRDHEGVWGPVVGSDNSQIQVRSRQDDTLVIFDVDTAAMKIIAQVFEQGGGSEWCSDPLTEPTSLNPTISNVRMVPFDDQGGPLIHAVWRADWHGEVEAAHFDPETLMWSAPTMLSSMVNAPAASTGDSILGADDVNGNAWVVSNDVSTANMRLHVHRFDADLGTWSDAILLDEPDHKLYYPALAVSPQGDAFVAAQINEDGVVGMREIIGFAWSDADQSWSEPILVGTTNESYASTFVEIEPVSGDVFVAWMHDDDTYLAHLDAQTQTWSEQVFPTALEQHSVRNLSAMGDGEVLLVLQDLVLDFPDSSSTITALVHDADGWGPAKTFATNVQLNMFGAFIASP